MDTLDIINFIKSDAYQSVLKKCVNDLEVTFPIEANITECEIFTQYIKDAGLNAFHLNQGINSLNFRPFFKEFSEFLESEDSALYILKRSENSQSMLIMPALFVYCIENGLDAQLRKFFNKNNIGSTLFNKLNEIFISVKF